ncbi:hypothetical protein BDR03DRAFT_977821 [Suillus americanus]|nr:hypothetical protein BDR03DRAFT_977821 [Suillus americanus]
MTSTVDPSPRCNSHRIGIDIQLETNIESPISVSLRWIQDINENPTLATSTPQNPSTTYLPEARMVQGSGKKRRNDPLSVGLMAEFSSNGPGHAGMIGHSLISRITLTGREIPAMEEKTFPRASPHLSPKVPRRFSAPAGFTNEQMLSDYLQHNSVPNFRSKYGCHRGGVEDMSSRLEKKATTQA